MYHLSNLGKFGKNVEKYADIDGYVPEQGDKPSQFRWDAMGEQWQDNEEWAEFVSEAVEATEKATA